MTTAQDDGPELGGDELVAAEYVLGVLDGEERRAASLRIERDGDFARLVDRWEARLAPMAAAYPDIEPRPGIKAALDRQLFEQPVSEVAPAGLWASLAFWRGLAGVAIAALALFVAFSFIAPSGQEPQARLVASLAAEGSDVHYLVVYDAAKGDVGLSHVSGERASGHDFELWMIEGGNPPVSMGVIPVGSSTHILIDAAARQRLAQGAVLAVSLEPSGGSTTGQPTGPVVASGDLKNI